MTDPTPIPAKPNVDNIAHMLRKLADDCTHLQAVIVVGIVHPNAPPFVAQYGQELGRLTEVGALHEAIRKITR